MLWLGQDPEVSRLASRFILYTLPCMLFYSLFDATRLFLVAIEEPSAVTAIVLVSVPLGALLDYLFVHTFGFGMLGLAISSDIISLALFITTSLYSQLTPNTKIRQAWSLPDRESLRDWFTILEIGAPGMLLYFIDWSCI